MSTLSWKREPVLEIHKYNFREGVVMRVLTKWKYYRRLNKF